MMQNNTTIIHLLHLLKVHGGSIVTGRSLTPYLIEQAKASGRFCEFNEDTSFIWEPDIDFPTTEEEIEAFEKWYPIPIPDADMIDPEKIINKIEHDQLKNNIV